LLGSLYSQVDMFSCRHFVLFGSMKIFFSAFTKRRNCATFWGRTSNL